MPKLRAQIFDCCLPDSGYKQTDDFEVEIYLYPKTQKHKRYYEIRVPINNLFNTVLSKSERYFHLQNYNKMFTKLYTDFC